MTRRLSRRTIALVTTVLLLIVVAAVAVGIHRDSTGSAPAADAPTSESSTSESSTSQRPAVTVQRYRYLPSGGDPRQDYGDLYLPAGEHANDSVPLVVLIHGGGWTSRYSATYFEPIARSLAARGYAAYNIEYRRIGSGGGWPTTFTDVAAAVDYVPTLDRLHPEIDTSDSTLVGHSAGAQLAVWAGTRRPGGPLSSGTTPDWRPTRIISLAGPLNLALAADTGDTRVTRALGGTPAQVPDRYRAVDPIENIDPAMPITAVHGTADRVVSPSQSMTFVAATERARGDARLVLLRGQSHSALVSPKSSAYSQVIDLIAVASRRTP